MKKTGLVSFDRIFIAANRMGGEDEYMTSKLFFSYEIDGVRRDGIFANIKQAAGGDYATSPLEVLVQNDDNFPFSHNDFQTVAEGLYREVIANVMKRLPNAKKYEMNECTIGNLKLTATLELMNPSAGW